MAVKRGRRGEDKGYIVALYECWKEGGKWGGERVQEGGRDSRRDGGWWGGRAMIYNKLTGTSSIPLGTNPPQSHHSAVVVDM